MRTLAPAFVLAFASIAFGDDELAVPSTIVTQGVPRIPLEQVRRFDPYQKSYTVTFQGWYGTRRQMLVAKPGQVLLAEAPGSEPRWLNVFDGPVGRAFPRPGHDQFVATIDRDGRERDQFFLADHRGGKPELLTDGRSRNLYPRWSDSGQFLAFADGSFENDRQVIRLLDPSAELSKRRIKDLAVGSLPGAWSPDDRRIAVVTELGGRQNNVVVVDLESGREEAVGRQIAYSTSRDSRRPIMMRWSSDGRALYWTSPGNLDFVGLVRYELESKKETWLTPSLRWDVDEFDVSSDGRTIVLIANEDGISKLHVLDAETGKEREAPPLPMGRASGLAFRPGSLEFGFTLDTPSAPARVHSYDLDTGRAELWGTSKREGRDPGAVDDVRLVRFRSFDGVEIPAFVYRPDRRAFRAPFPVLISLHGGPMEQVRATYLNTSAYDVNELGIAVVLPNVRGSSGYGLIYEHLDDGANREGSIKDVGALLDWIATQPDLDKDRVAVAGGSYGGFLSLSSLARYGNRLCAGIDICGISDLSIFLANTAPRNQAPYLAEYGDVRDPRKAAFLHDVSPLSRTSKINLPLLVVHGDNDPRVPVSEAARLVTEVRKNGGPVWCVLGKGEGHGFTRAENIWYLIHVQNLFLYRYLGPARPAIFDPQRSRAGH